MSDNINDNPTDDISLTTEERPEKPKNASAIGLLFDILFTGSAGWKRLRRTRLTPEKTAAGCFYPLLAVAAASRFADWFYIPEFNLPHTLVQAVSIFASFFFSYFTAQVLCRWFLPSEAKGKTETSYFKLLVQYSLASLALFMIPAEIFPIIEPLTVFLPIWTVFIITKGVRFLRFPTHQANRCMVTTVLSTVASPYVFMWIFDKIF